MHCPLTVLVSNHTTLSTPIMFTPSIYIKDLAIWMLKQKRFEKSFTKGKKEKEKNRLHSID